MVETSSRALPLSTHASIDTLNDCAPSLVHGIVTTLSEPVGGMIASVNARGVAACGPSLGSKGERERDVGLHDRDAVVGRVPASASSGKVHRGMLLVPNMQIGSDLLNCGYQGCAPNSTQGDALPLSSA
jgi:hypothetical protein